MKLSKCFRERSIRVVILLSCLFIFISLFAGKIYDDTVRNYRIQHYGKHNGCVFHVEAAVMDVLKQHQAVTERACMDITGSVLRDDASGSPTEIGYIGRVDQTFQEWELIPFMEGGYPENDSEIAMETILLDALNLPYILGNQIELAVRAEGGHIEHRTYHLCGIINSWTSNWKQEGHPLAGALTCGKEPAMESHLFFGSIYETKQQMEELLPLLESSRDSELVFNDYSYPPEETGFLAFLRTYVYLLPAVLGSILLQICVQISSYGKKKERIHLLKLLGIRPVTLRKLILFSQLDQVIVIYMGCAGLFLFGSVLYVKISGTSFQEILNPTAYVLVFICTVGVFLFGRMAQYRMLFLNSGSEDASGVINEKRLRKNFTDDINEKRAGKNSSEDRNKKAGKNLTGIINDQRVGKERRNRKKEKQNRNNRGADQPFVDSIHSFIKREKRCRRTCLRMEMILCVFFLLVLACSTFFICEWVRGSRRNAGNSDQSYEWVADAGEGLTPWQIRKMEHTEGIDRVVYTSDTICSHTNQQFSLETEDGISSAEQDRYRTAVISYQNGDEITVSGEKAVIQGKIDSLYDSAEASPDSLPVHIMMLPENSVLWSYYFPEDADPAAFTEGDSVLAFLPDLFYSSEKKRYFLSNVFALASMGHDTDLVVCTDVQAGDTLYIRDESGDREAVECLRVLKKAANPLQQSIDFLLPGTVLVSEKLYLELSGQDEIRYNHVMAYAKENATFHATDCQMSAITDSQRVSFTNYRLERERQRTENSMILLILSCIVMMVLLFLLVMIYRNRIILMDGESAYIDLMRTLGCRQEILDRIFQRRPWKQLLAFHITINAGIAAARWGLGYGSMLLSDHSFGNICRLLQYCIYDFPWEWYLGGQIVMLALLFILLELPFRRISSNVR